MDVVAGPIGSGVQQITDLNPFAGVLIGGLIAATLYFIVENRTLRRELRERDLMILADKDKQLEEAKKERELFERLADEQAKRRRT